MSRNAHNKRIARNKHRDQFSPLPRGTGLAFLITKLEPVETPLLALIGKAA